MNNPLSPLTPRFVAAASVLVAEDDPTDQFLLRRALEKAGFDVAVHFVSDGSGVLEFLQRVPSGQLPGLLLLDLKMPGLDGFEVLEWLLQKPEFRPPNVVVFSSSLDSLDIARACRLGVDHYLVKPRDPAELIATVKRLESYWTEPPPMYVPAAEQSEPARLATAA